jgi:hypothetical protein
MSNALTMQHAAREQADRLAPRGVAPEFLAEAIWHRTLAQGSMPTDAEVAEYLARCASDHTPVSGRQEHERAIQPRETYRGADTVINVRRKGRGQYEAYVVGTFALVGHGRTRSIIHRVVETAHPGGEWSASLSTSDLAAIRQRWGIKS